MKSFGKIDFPALSQLLQALDPTAIPRWTGNVQADTFAFAKYELGAIEFRLNRADPEAMRHAISQLRKHIDQIESELLPMAEHFAAQKERQK